MTAGTEADPHAGRDDRGAGYIPTLDGWRAIAIAVVMLFHGRVSIEEAAGIPMAGLKDAVPDFGLAGVRIFFALSGFLICSRLIDEGSRGRIGLGAFYVRRCFRILPPLAAMMLTVLALASAGAIRVPFREWLAGLFFAGNYAHGAGTSHYVVHLWSLAVEEHFYLIFPAAIALAGARRGLALSVSAAVAVAAWRAVALGLSSHSPRFDAEWFWSRTDIVADGLLWGCAAAFLARTGREGLRAMLRPAAWWAILIALASSVPLRHGLPWKWSQTVFSAQSVGFSALIVGTVLWPRAATGRFLESAPMRWVGRLSYSLYLWQQLFLVDTPSAASSWPALRAIQSFPANIAASFACALASYHLVERPMIAMGRRLAGRRVGRERTP